MVPQRRTPEATPLIRSHRAILLAAALALVSALAVLRAAEASWMVPPAPDRPKDFAIVKRNGLYHLFYIRNNPNLPFGETQYDFGHAVSEDLYFWQHRAPVLGRRPGLFDRTHVWAPSIVQRDGVYYMLYTGVSDTVGVHGLYQRTGVATSTDLDDWNALEAPVFDCWQAPWAVQDSVGSAPFRDPFVMADPATPGGWLMYYSTRPSSDPGMVVGAATSAGDLTAWQDAGPMWITHRSYSYNDVVESPHLFEHNGLWFLFFTTNSGQPISYATGNDPLGGPQAWIYRGRLANMLNNVNTAAWFASEHLRDGLVEYFCFVNGDRVEIARMVWTAPDRFSLTQPDLFHVQSLNWLSPTVRAGSQTTLYIASKWWTGKTANLECFWVDSLGAWHPVPNATLGIPDAIPITADLHTFQWVARSLPAELGAPEAPNIVVRLLDQTATANPIQVLPQTGSGDPEPPPEPSGYPSAGSEELVERGAHPKLRTLRNLVYGMPSLLVDFAAGERARLDLFDLQGRRVRALADRRFEKGATVVTWDGRDDSGRRMEAGLYFARLTTAGVTRAARLLLR